MAREQRLSADARRLMQDLLDCGQTELIRVRNTDVDPHTNNIHPRDEDGQQAEPIPGVRDGPLIELAGLGLISKSDTKVVLTDRGLAWTPDHPDDRHAPSRRNQFVIALGTVVLAIVATVTLILSLPRPDDQPAAPTAVESSVATTSSTVLQSGPTEEMSADPTTTSVDTSDELGAGEVCTVDPRSFNDLEVANMAVSGDGLCGRILFSTIGPEGMASWLPPVGQDWSLDIDRCGLYDSREGILIGEHFELALLTGEGRELASEFKSRVPSDTPLDAIEFQLIGELPGVDVDFGTCQAKPPQDDSESKAQVTFRYCSVNSVDEKCTG